jgi:hypothetical protein
MHDIISSRTDTAGWEETEMEYTGGTDCDVDDSPFPSHRLGGRFHTKCQSTYEVSVVGPEEP